MSNDKQPGSARRRASILQQLVIFLVCFSLSGCEFRYERVEDDRIVDMKQRTTCIDGVEYIMIGGDGRRGYMAPHFKPDGKLYICEK